MKMYNIYVCEKCGKESRNRDGIYLCEANHVGLPTISDYETWKLLNEYAQACTSKLSTTNNEDLRKKEEDAYEKLFAFEKEHNMKV